MKNFTCNKIFKAMTCAVILLSVVFIIACGHSPRMHLRILLVTSIKQLKPDAEVWSASPAKAKGYIDLLSFSAIPYDVAWIEKPESFGKFRAGLFESSHSLVIIALSQPDSSAALEALVKKANSAGIGVLADVNSLDDKLISYFRLKISPDVFTAEELTYKMNNKNYRFGSRRFRKFILQKKQKVVAAFENEPVIIRTEQKKAGNYILGIEGDDIFQHHDFFHQLLKNVLLDANEKGAVIVPLDHTAVLRLDDPGTSHKLWQMSEKYDTIDADVTASQWEEITGILRQFNARLSIMYTPMFVDDGDAGKGQLTVNGKTITDRKCGNLYLSKEVSYAKNMPPHVFDYTKEYEALRKGMKEDILDIQLHGYAHITPYSAKWCAAADKIDNELWMAEYYDAINKQGIPLSRQEIILKNALDAFHEDFQNYPSTFSPPLHFYDSNTLTAAKQNGLVLLHSLQLFQLYTEPIIENDKIKTVWAHRFKLVRQSFIRAGYPLVLGLHDWDFKHHPVQWFKDYLGVWKKNGIKRFISFSEFAAYLSLKVDAVTKGKSMVLTVTPGDTRMSHAVRDSFFSTHEASLIIKMPQGKTIENVACNEQRYHFKCAEDSLCTITIPPFSNEASSTITISLAERPVSKNE